MNAERNAKYDLGELAALQTESGRLSESFENRSASREQRPLSRGATGLTLETHGLQAAAGLRRDNRQQAPVGRQLLEQGVEARLGMALDHDDVVRRGAAAAIFQRP